jgi:hypothetical protein
MNGQREHDQNLNVTAPFRVSPDERHAVHLNRGIRLTTPARVPKEPTLPPTAGRMPAAHLEFEQDAQLRPALRLQSGQGCGDSVPAEIDQRGALYDAFSAFAPPANIPAERKLDEAEIRALIEFFTLLDTWERKLHATENL